MIKSIEWLHNRVRFIDQTQLPLREEYIETDDSNVIAEAIRTLRLRGAPLIGIAAAYGVALASLHYSGKDLPTFQEYLRRVSALIASTRPTAVNLSWSLQRMCRVYESAPSITVAQQMLIAEGIAIHHEDEEMCRRIGKNGQELISQTATILTHCNTGALATGGEGTAQSVITSAHRMGKNIHVFVDETRPLLQGARLTMWEFMKLGIPATLITDSTAAVLMKEGKIDLVIVGADRIASNGDTANKIGTYNLAINARHHRVPFYVAAPSSTIDSSLQTGDEIPIEQRSPDEITTASGNRSAPEGTATFSPAFDVTPSEFITAIITEQQVCRTPYRFNTSVEKDEVSV